MGRVSAALSSRTGTTSGSVRSDPEGCARRDGHTCLQFSRLWAQQCGRSAGLPRNEARKKTPSDQSQIRGLTVATIRTSYRESHPGEAGSALLLVHWFRPTVTEIPSQSTKGLLEKFIRSAEIVGERCTLKKGAANDYKMREPCMLRSFPSVGTRQVVPI